MVMTSSRNLPPRGRAIATSRVADFKSERPRSNRNRWPPSFRNQWPASSGISSDHAVRRRRPDKPAALQSLGVQRHAQTVMPENLDQIAPPPAEYEQIAGVRVALQSLLDLERQPVHPAPHIAVPGRDPHPDTTGNRDHRRSAAANSGGVSTAMRTRTAPANSISIAAAGRRAASSLPLSSTAAITTSDKPPPVLRSSCRHR